MIVAAVADSRDFLDTISSFRSFVAGGLDGILASGIAPTAILAEIYRRIHTFKGALLQFSFYHAPQILHDLETRLDELQKKGDDLSWDEVAMTAKSVNYAALLERDLISLRAALGDDFLEQGDKILLSAQQLRQLSNDARRLADSATSDEMKVGLAQLADNIAKLNKVAFADAIASYDALIQQAAARMEKELEPLAVEGGGEIWVDPDVYGPFIRSLVHVFRNAVAHGIEDPETRYAAGKPEAGHISCDIVAEDGRITMTIADDGRGLNFTALRRKAVTIGLYSDAEIASLPDAALAEIIFHDSVSTKEQADEMSGRGVGLAAVRAETEALGGRVTVRSEAGQGTRFVFTLPLH